MLCHYVRTYMYHKAFPTRRSSYLECYQRTIRRSFHWVKHTVQTITKLHYGFSVWKVLTSFNSLYAWNTKAGDFGEHFWRDRKSTRLNSSHVAISYAVFCLKKKKATIGQTPLSTPPRL